MKLSDLHHLFDYTFWASERLLATAAALPPEQWGHDLGSSFPSVRDTFAHLIGAEWVWLLRWREIVPKGPPDWKQGATAEVLLVALRELHEDRQRFLATIGDADLARVFRFRSLSGEPGAQPLGQLMLHVINHSTYHRGQIATMLRQLGTAPPGTDLYLFNLAPIPLPDPGDR